MSEGNKKHFIERLWRLPPPDKRRDNIIPLRWFNKFFSLNKDGEYLCYQLFLAVSLLGAVLLVAIVLDILLRTGLFINPQAFDRNKLLLPVTFSRLIPWPVLAVTLLFYLRIRLPIDIKNDTIPVLMHRALLIGYTRRRWIFRCFWILFISGACIFISHVVVIRFTLHFHQQDSLSFILLPQVVVVVAIATFAACLVSYGLVLEKVICCFPQFEQDLLTMNPLPRNY